MRYTVSLFLIFLAFSQNTFSQKEKFKARIELTQKIIYKGFEPIESVVFNFQGTVHEFNFYHDLSKKLKRNLKKSFDKDGKTIGFKFNLFYSKAYYTGIPETEKHDMKIINNKPDERDFQYVAMVNFRNFKGWDNHLYNTNKRKQNYDLNIHLYSTQTSNKVLQLVFNCSTFYHIGTNNKTLASIILEELFNAHEAEFKNQID